MRATQSELVWVAVPLLGLITVRICLVEPIRRRLAPLFRRLCDLLAEPVDPEDVAEELARYRVGRLHWMDERLRQLEVLLDDDTLPATRQVGVRIAYRTLSHDAAVLTTELGAVALDPFVPPARSADPDVAATYAPAERTIHEEMVFS